MIAILAAVSAILSALLIAFSLPARTSKTKAKRVAIVVGFALVCGFAISLFPSTAQTSTEANHLGRRPTLFGQLRSLEAQTESLSTDLGIQRQGADLERQKAIAWHDQADLEKGKRETESYLRRVAEEQLNLAKSALQQIAKSESQEGQPGHLVPVRPAPKATLEQLAISERQAAVDALCWKPCDPAARIACRPIYAPICIQPLIPIVILHAIACPQ